MYLYKSIRFLAIIMLLLTNCANENNKRNTEIPTSNYKYEFFQLNPGKANIDSYNKDYIDISTDEKNNIFLLDIKKNRLRKFNKNGAFLQEFGQTGQDKKSLLNPSEIEIDNSGNIYVLDWGNKRIVKLNNHLKYLNSFSINEFKYYEPPTLSVSEQANIVLCFPKINGTLIHILDQKGKKIKEFGEVETFENPPFEGPSEVATWVMNKANIINRGNKFYVFYVARPLMRIYNQDGKLIKETAIQGNEIARLKQDNKERKDEHAATNDNKQAYKWTQFYTDALKIDDNNFLLFLPTKLGAIYMLNSKGKTIEKFKSKEMMQAPLQTREYTSINNNIYVGLDRGNNSLHKFYLKF